ncbi:MAG TPA: hypothetical protein VGQ99_03320 [Tepidisphaeraceae bacterium]|jgi:hypothetical protein|nr:hypothetical protein [Tepidisphaeraceae bacterium]
MTQESLPPPIPDQKRLLLSPSDIPADPDGSLPWWKPSWTDVAQRLGWRWLYLIPATLVLVLAIWAIFSRAWFINIWWWGGKLWIWIGAGAVGAVVEAMRQATKARAEPFCIHCGYTLSGLPDQHICPECGRPYSFQLIKEYQHDPKWFVQRWKSQHGNPINERFEARKSTGRASGDGT